MQFSRRLLVRLAAAMPLLLLAPSCGGGGGPEIVLTGITAVNSTITSAGGTNTHAITQLDAVGPGPTFLTYYPSLTPGESVFVPLGTGNWFVTVTYTDGTHETGQVAVDPVGLTDGEDETVAFLY